MNKAEQIAELKYRIEAVEETLLSMATDDPELEDKRQQHIDLLDKLAELDPSAV